MTDIGSLLHACRTAEQKALVLLALRLGATAREASGIQTSDITWNGHAWFIRLRDLRHGTILRLDRPTLAALAATGRLDPPDQPAQEPRPVFVRPGGRGADWTWVQEQLRTVDRRRRRAHYVGATMKRILWIDLRRHHDQHAQKPWDLELCIRAAGPPQHILRGPGRPPQADPRPGGPPTAQPTGSPTSSSSALPPSATFT